MNNREFGETHDNIVVWVELLMPPTPSSRWSNSLLLLSVSQASFAMKKRSKKSIAKKTIITRIRKLKTPETPL